MSACIADIICITQITLKEINNVLLVDNWRFGFLSFKLIFDLVACKVLGPVNYRNQDSHGIVFLVAFF